MVKSLEKNIKAFGSLKQGPKVINHKKSQIIKKCTVIPTTQRGTSVHQKDIGKSKRKAAPINRFLNRKRILVEKLVKFK